MNETEALNLINATLEKVLTEPVAVTAETDMIDEEILDSLDGMVFMLEIESATGKKFPEDIDLVKEGFYKVPKLIQFLSV